MNEVRIQSIPSDSTSTVLVNGETIDTASFELVYTSCKYLFVSLPFSSFPFPLTWLLLLPALSLRLLLASKLILFMFS